MLYVLFVKQTCQSLRFYKREKIDLLIQTEFILKWILLDWGYSGKVKEMNFARLWRCKREKCINFATHI